MSCYGVYLTQCQLDKAVDQSYDCPMTYMSYILHTYHFSTFAMLRPYKCDSVLADSSGTHSVCVCSLQQNAKLMFCGSKIATLSEGAISHYQHCLAAIMCDPPRIQCHLGNACKQCPGTDRVSWIPIGLIQWNTNNGYPLIVRQWKLSYNRWMNFCNPL